MTNALVPLSIDHEGCTWPLWQHSGNNTEPLALDLDLARWLEFSYLYDIRKLIRRYAKELGEVFATVAKTPGPEGGRPGKSYYLTEAQALFLAAKSETPKAHQVLKAMIAVFMLARRGLLPQPAARAELPRLHESPWYTPSEAANYCRMHTTPALRRLAKRLGYPLPPWGGRWHRDVLDCITARLPVGEPLHLPPPPQELPIARPTPSSPRHRSPPRRTGPLPKVTADGKPWPRHDDGTPYSLELMASIESIRELCGGAPKRTKKPRN